MSEFSGKRMSDLLTQLWEDSGSAQISRYPTGLEGLDRYLGGGLQPGLTVLGAVPNIGKTTLALQIAENIAKSGTPVLYYSLEVSDKWICMKAVSRLLFLESGLNEQSCLSANELRRAQPEVREKFFDALEKLRESAENFYVITSNRKKALTAQFIADNAEEFIRENEKKPVVFVDYLQLLSPDDKTAYQDNRRSTDVVIAKLTTLARNNGIPVFLISSLSRSSYDTPARMQDFKESGAIEYSADVLLEMQMYAVHEGKKEVETAKSRSPRDVELVILKQRYGECGEDVAVRLSYYSKFNLFLEGKPANKAADGKKRKWFFINNSLVMNRIRRGDYEHGDGKTNTDPQNNVSFTLSDSIDAYDCAILDAVYTLLLERPEKQEFLTRNIYKLLAGAPQSVSDGSLKMLEERIARMAGIRCSLVYGEGERREGILLPAERVGTGHRFRLRRGEEMPFCRHRQFYRYPRELLHVTEALSGAAGPRSAIANTDEIIRLKVCLMHEIEIRRSMNVKEKRLKYSTIFEEAFGRETSPQREKWIGSIKRILDYYRHVGYLTDYREYMEGIELLGAICEPAQLEFAEEEPEHAEKE